MKKIILLICTLTLFGCSNDKLPNPEVSEGFRGQLGIDANINETNIDNYLNRQDIVYYDMRMLVDEAKYENINGDSYISGFVKGFEILPLPYIAPVLNLPEEVGKPYDGKTLFSIKDNKYVANYQESLDILNYFFPKGKKIFLMCGGGGYAGQTKSMLVSLGWDENNIYNVGAYWSYEGNNNVTVKTIRNKQTAYDFWKIPYHNIEFESLTKI